MTAAIVLMIAGMIVYPQIKSRMKASKDAAEVVPPAGSQVRKQVLNINAEVLKYQSLTDKTIVTGSTIPDEEVDLSFESSGKIVAIYFTEGTHVKAGDLLAKINDKPLQAEPEEAGSSDTTGERPCIPPAYAFGKRRSQPGSV